MGRLIVANQVTLDGVLQAPGAADEDTRDGFPHGGWARLHEDPAVDAAMGAKLTDMGSFLFGRRTYDDLFDHWAGQVGTNPYADALTNTRKYVASRTVTEPLRWANSTLLRGDVAAAVGEVKAGEQRDIVVFGSGDLLRTLLRHDLVDTIVLMTHPVVLGTGRRMFPDGSAELRLRLVDSVTAPSGVVVATYER